MAIVEDASTPVPVDQNDGTSLTTASFSPPAGSMIVAMAGIGWSNAASSITVADSSGGGNWAGTFQNYSGGNGFLGSAAIAYKYFATAPGSITVTATLNNTSGGPNALAVKVLTGADSTIGATAGRQRANGIDVDEAITPQATGSFLYAVAHFNDLATTGNPTDLANTDTIHYIHEPNTDISAVWAFEKATATSSTSQVIIGGDLVEASPGSIVHMEIKESQSVSGTLATAAPLAQADVQVAAEVDGPVGITAPLAQADVQADVIVDGPLATTAPLAQVDLTGDVQVNTLQPVAPLAQLTMAGEEQVIDAVLAVTAPLSQVSLPTEVTVSGTADPTAPGATFSSQGALTVSGTADPTAPLASLSVVGGYAGGPLAVTAPLATLAIGSETRIFGRRVIVAEQDFNNRVLEVPSDQPPETFYV